MTIREPSYTLDDFQAFIEHPDNAGRLFEFINGEIIEVSPGRTINSEYRDIIAHKVRTFCEQKHIRCHTSAGDGAYRIAGQVIAPDFAYKPTRMSNEYPDPVPPLWAIEVISPTDEPDAIRAKRNTYIQAGILLGELYPKSQSIDIYEPGKPVRTLGINDVLDAGDVLPGFKLPVREIFADDDEDDN